VVKPLLSSSLLLIEILSHANYLALFTGAGPDNHGVVS
jgi:hypothetical protein